jgi:two-component system cell cycle sensor histidine kinase/response regulator CckA
LLKNHSDIVGASALERSGDLRARGIETVLVVEDEQPVRTIVRRMLESFGYAVLEADGPDRALAIVAAMEGTIQLLLTDLVMPGMDGRELAQRLGQLRPDVRVLFMSGYADSAERYMVERRHFLQKPFSPSALSQKVREAIDARDWN